MSILHFHSFQPVPLPLKDIDDVAGNGNGFILLDTKNSSVIQLDSCFRPQETILLKRKYTSICYDFYGKCYWAIEEHCAQTLYQLDTHFQEINRICIKNAKNRYANSMRFDNYERSVWFSFPDCVGYIKRNAYDLTCIQNKSADICNNGILPLGTCHLVSFMEDTRQFIDAFQSGFYQNISVCLPKEYTICGMCHSQHTPIHIDKQNIVHNICLLLKHHGSGNVSLMNACVKYCDAQTENYICDVCMDTRLKKDGTCPCETLECWKSWQTDDTCCDDESTEESCSRDEDHEPHSSCCEEQSCANSCDNCSPTPCLEPPHPCDDDRCPPPCPTPCLELPHPCDDDRCPPPCPPPCPKPPHPCDDCCPPPCPPPCPKPPHPCDDCCPPPCPPPCPKPPHPCDDCCPPPCPPPCPKPPHPCDDCCPPPCPVACDCRCCSCKHCKGCCKNCCEKCCNRAKWDLLESIALEETGIAHILNAEGEKIQKAVACCRCIEDLLRVNASVQQTIIHATNLESQLYLKLEAVINSHNCDCSCTMPPFEECCEKALCD